MRNLIRIPVFLDRLSQNLLIGGILKFLITSILRSKNEDQNFSPLSYTNFPWLIFKGAN